MSLLSSCSKDDSTTTVTEDDSTTTITEPLNFSASPIDLQGIDVNFARDIAYDSYPNTKFDIFLPTSSTPTALVIYIHGGKFIGGDKSYVYNGSYPEDLRTLLSNNIAVATINYRVLSNNNETEGVIKSLNDSKRALQYIRSRAVVFNIEKDKVALTGSSAGAGTSFWLATNDDLKDASNTDSVFHESTRVKAIALIQTQASYDGERWVDVFADYGTTWDELFNADPDFFLKFYGISSLAEYNTPEIDAYRERIDMLTLLTTDDPDIWVNNTKSAVAPPSAGLNITNHHAFHAREIKIRADMVGVPIICYYGKDPILYSDPSGEGYVDFLIRKLNE